MKTSGPGTSKHVTWSLGTAARRVILASACLVCAHALAEEPTPAAAGAQATATIPRRTVSRRTPAQVMDQRVRIIARGLDLDARQQAAVRKILESQQEQIRRAWANPSIPASDRVTATRGILERTRERIRGVLNEEQRKKYPAARTPGAPSPPPPDVEHWMRLTERNGGQAGKAN